MANPIEESFAIIVHGGEVVLSFKAYPFHVVDANVIAVHESQAHSHCAAAQLQVVSVAQKNKLGSCAAVEVAVEGHLHPRAVA